MTLLAIATLAAWLTWLPALVLGRGEASGYYLLAAPALSIALAVAVIA